MRQDVRSMSADASPHRIAQNRDRFWPILISSTSGPTGG